MNKAFLYFGLGLAVGAAGSSLVLKTRYNMKMVEEVANVRERLREYYFKKSENVDEKPEVKLADTLKKENDMRGSCYDTTATNKDPDPAHEGKTEYNPYEFTPIGKISSLVRENKYATSEKTSTATGPYRIPEDEFDTKPLYDIRSFVLYSNNVLLDEYDNIVEGSERLGLVGDEFEQPLLVDGNRVCYIRNETLKTDFEICLDLNDYEEDEE